MARIKKEDISEFAMEIEQLGTSDSTTDIITENTNKPVIPTSEFVLPQRKENAAVDGFVKDMTFGTPKNVKNIASPLLLLDFSLGGGLGEGQWMEIFGPEGVGKTTLALLMASFFLEMNPKGFLLYIDTEKAMPYERISEVFFQDNVEIDDESGIIYLNGEPRGILSSPDTYEQIDILFGKFVNLCTKNNFEGVLVWDSLVTATSEKLLKDGKERVAYKATAIQELIEKYNATFQRVPITQIVINQIRQKIDMGMFSSNKGEGEMVDSDYVLPGGNAHKFMSFQTVMLVKSTKWGFPKTTPICEGRTARFIPTKNKMGAPRREVKNLLLFEIGYSNIISLLEYLNDRKMLEGKGLSSIKVKGMDMLKGMTLPNFAREIYNNDDFCTRFMEVCFEMLVNEYKAYSKLHRFNKDTIKLAMKLDAKKLVKYFDTIMQRAKENGVDIDAIDE